jgi:dimethylhistidine N-methyltransferase
MLNPPPQSPGPLFVQLFREDSDVVRRELIDGLARPQAQAAPKHLYDLLGSRLFEAITELPEYYPTRTERAIFDRHAAEMAAHAGTGRALVDLGAGNCAKAARLFNAFRPARYVAVDISTAFLKGALGSLQREHPEIAMVGVGMDFSSTFELPAEAGPGPRTLFYPGSSIGNFNPDAALAFLTQARAACAGGALVIGVDLIKDHAMLEAAYDDPLQVTAAFNRNLLLHFNRLAGTDFRLADWAHRAFFNAAQARIEMHLVANRAVTVGWPGGERHFAAGATIHTENSYKWRVADFERLLAAAGFDSPRHWQDRQGWFAVFVAQA